MWEEYVLALSSLDILFLRNLIIYQISSELKVSMDLLRMDINLIFAKMSIFYFPFDRTDGFTNNSVMRFKIIIDRLCKAFAS